MSKKRVYAFMDYEVFPVFLADKSVLTMRTLEGQLAIKSVIIGSECSLADLTQYLTCLAIVFVEIRLGSMTRWAGAILRDVALRTSLDRLNWFAIVLGIVVVEIFPIPVLMIIDNLRKFIHFELLIFWRMRIIESPLFERYISADEIYQPAVLLIELLNDLK